MLAEKIEKKFQDDDVSDWLSKSGEIRLRKLHYNIKYEIIKNTKLIVSFKWTSITSKQNWRLLNTDHRHRC